LFVLRVQDVVVEAVVAVVQLLMMIPLTY